MQYKSIRLLLALVNTFVLTSSELDIYSHIKKLHGCSDPNLVPAKQQSLGHQNVRLINLRLVFFFFFKVSLKFFILPLAWQASCHTSIAMLCATIFAYKRYWPCFLLSQIRSDAIKKVGIRATTCDLISQNIKEILKHVYGGSIAIVTWIVGSFSFSLTWSCLCLSSLPSTHEGRFLSSSIPKVLLRCDQSELSRLHIWRLWS